MMILSKARRELVPLYRIRDETHAMNCLKMMAGKVLFLIPRALRS